MRTVKMKQHPNFPNYVVDENGYIYSKINGYDNGTGYRLYKLTNNDGEKVYQLGHRFTYEAWNEEMIPEGLEIHHKNWVRDDNHIDNLEMLTKSENRLLKKPKK
jgi:hypothetical protein